MHFNTAIAAVMELVNDINDHLSSSRDKTDAFVCWSAAVVVRLLFPFVPHITSELWERLGQSPQLAEVAWPTYDPAALLRDTVEIAVQVNGKLRSRITVAAGADKENLLEAALADQRIIAFLDGQTPRKTVVVPGRLVNIVV